MVSLLIFLILQPQTAVADSGLSFVDALLMPRRRVPVSEMVTFWLLNANVPVEEVDSSPGCKVPSMVTEEFLTQALPE